MATLKPDLSIVTTLYCSAPYIQEFYQRILAEISKTNYQYEIIFVNDGSPDNVLDLTLDLQKHNPRIIIVDLSRNFGHHKAIMEGLYQSKGTKVLLIDCDLEEPPELLARFLEKMDEADCDVVYGVLKTRKGGLGERLFGTVFFKVFNYIADINVPENWTIARLMSRRYVNSLLEYREEDSLFLGGVMTCVGYKQSAVELTTIHKGSTTYTFSRKVAAAVAAVTSFSDKPLRFIFYSGLVISITSFLFASYLVAQRIFLGTSITGWTSLAVSIWFLGGLIIVFLGVIGIYLAKIFSQTKRRPQVVVRQIYR